jgi:calcium-dependent protein kinase
MDKLDFNNNGTIDYSEFLIAHLNVNKLLTDDKLMEVFNLFDYDNSGSITAKEIKKVLGSGKGVGDNIIDDCEWEKIIDEVDEDGNGEISFSEFRDMIYRLFSVKVEK